jgi:chromosome segregation protein
VLAALRQSGRQIICAVEDQALADLLCRRLSGSAAEGIRIDLAAQGSRVMAEQRIVPPLPQNVLRPKKTALAVG